MFKNHIKTALRNMMKNKVFSVINITGLTIGITSFLLIALYVFDELTFDRFHANAADIYRVILHKKNAEGKEIKIAAAGYMISTQGKKELPEIKNVVRIGGLGRANVSTLENKNIFYEDFWVANAGFLQSFSFKGIQGDLNTALIAPHSVVVTEETAQKFFHTSNVLGKVIMIDRDTLPFKITAVLKDFPVNSHLSFNLLFSESSIEDANFTKAASADWGNESFTTYLQLSHNTNPRLAETKMNALLKANEKETEKGKSYYTLQPLKDVHFHSEGITGRIASTSNISYIYVFCIVALFVLVIACINYMNLTTARFSNRAKEIAVRKIAGASRENLITQFLFEAFIMTMVSLVLAILIVNFLLPSFNAFTGKQLSLGYETDCRIWVGVGLTVVAAMCMAGVYPAIFQSGLKPLLLLKSKVYAGKGNISLRKSLVVFQFSISIIMIVATIIVYQQMIYVNTKDMGFNKEQLLVIDINSDGVRNGEQVIKNEFGKLAQVKDVCVSSRVPGEWKNLPKVNVVKEGADVSAGTEMFFMGVDDQFINTYQLKLLKGRNFMANNKIDSLSVMINETAARQLGITEASGQLIQVPAVNYGAAYHNLNTAFNVRIVGIIKDFNFQSLHDPLAPIVLACANNPIQAIDYFTVRVTNNNVTAAIEKMETILHNIDQNHLFEYHFLDKQWERFYREDKIQETIFFIIALLAILIACLGLFGLATYAAEQRLKEIGIRKVLGASVENIVAMLSKEFLKLVLIAAVIALPVAWFSMHQWLQNFAFRINIGWWGFIIAIVIALLISFFTVSFQAFKAAIANPVKSLKAE